MAPHHLGAAWVRYRARRSSTWADYSALLAERGYRTVGPVARDGAVVHGDLSEAAICRLAGTTTRLRAGTGSSNPELFDWAVGPASWKSEFFKPAETVWRATVLDGAVAMEVPSDAQRRVAIVGARPCELAVLDVLDRVLARGAVPDERHTARRAGTLLVAVECGTPSSTCSCTSMGTGPDAGPGYDFALTELLGDVHHFYVGVGTEAGAELLEHVGWTAATEEDPPGAPGGRGRGAPRHGALAPHPRPRRPARAQPRAPALGRCGRARDGHPEAGRVNGGRHHGDSQVASVQVVAAGKVGLWVQ